MTKKHHSFNCEDFEWQALITEAEKEKISVNQLLQRVVGGFVNKSEVLPIVTNYDIEIKKFKLEEIKENIRRKRNDNTHFERYGYYPTKPASFVKEIVPNPPTQQKVWSGAGNSQQLTQTVDPRITDISENDWEMVLPTLTDFEKNSTMPYSCIVNGCGLKCQKDGTIKQHLIDNHESVLQKNLRALKSW